MAENEKKEAVTLNNTDNKDKKDAAPKKNKESLCSRFKVGFKNLKSEFKKIVWYPKDSTIHSTILVLVSVVILSAFIGLLDYLFSIGIVGLGRLI